MGAGLLAGPLAFAQTGRKFSVAVLFAGEEQDDEPAMRPFFEEMRRLGWSESTNLAYERHYGRGTREYMEGLAKSAAGRGPDLIYATTANIAQLVLKETSIPVVFTAVSDPVAAGLVSSLEKPGGNATGAFPSAAGVVRKRLELVRAAFPRVKRFGLVLDRRSTDYLRQKGAHEDSARLLGLELAVAEFVNFEAVARLFANFRKQEVTAAVLTPSVALLARRREVVATALRNRVALAAHRVEWAEAGAVMTYGAEITETLKRSAAIVDRILRGVRPADIPVEQTTKFELVVNRRTANALGLAVPLTLLRQADRIIE